VAQQPKKEAAAPEAQAALDERGQALSKLLPSALEGLDVEIGASAGEALVIVKPEDVPAVCRLGKETSDLDFDYLRCLSVVDYVDRLEVVYHLFSVKKRHKMVVKTSVSPDTPSVPSVVSVWRAADWFEREGHDLYGVVFEGHPELAPLLLWEGFEGYPGRRSFPFHEYDEW